MELNIINAGIRLMGTYIKSIDVKNNIINIKDDAVRKFGLNINEPKFKETDNGLFSQMAIDFEVEIEQSDDSNCKIELSLEGAFISEGDTDEDAFKQLVAINGAAALIGIARGKIESISSSIFDNGKIVIPFVNVVDYYKSLNE
jgi:hypothetical protein